MKMIERRYLLPFILVTCCFALWGFANDITNPMVKAFSKIFRMSVTDGTLVQVAFYGGYFCMALPAALFVRRHSYKSGLLMGLGLYALGALLFMPACATGGYYPFLFAYFILTCGLSFLETTANPYILSLGSPETATRRLNLAQAFNPIGSLAGMWVAMHFIQARLNPLSSSERALLADADFEAVKQADLQVLSAPYVAIGIVLLAVFVLMLILLPGKGAQNAASPSVGGTVARLWRNKRYRYGVVAQFFYVGLQIMCWTFIIQYGTHLFTAEGMPEQQAEVLSQRYNIAAMVLFCVGRFVSTLLMRRLEANRLMASLAALGVVLLLAVIFVGGRVGLVCLVGVSACMSLMFPTIYGLALDGVGHDAEFGSAGLIMSILGGSLLPPLQAMVIDGVGMASLPAVRLSFVVPLFCIIIVLIYSIYTIKHDKKSFRLGML